MSAAQTRLPAHWYVWTALAVRSHWFGIDARLIMIDALRELEAHAVLYGAPCVASEASRLASTIEKTIPVRRRRKISGKSHA